MAGSSGKAAWRIIGWILIVLAVSNAAAVEFRGGIDSLALGGFLLHILLSPILWIGLVLLWLGRHRHVGTPAGFATSSYGSDRAVSEVDGTKKCPYCAETIKLEAVKCRFCGSELNSAEVAAAMAEHQRLDRTCPNCGGTSVYRDYRNKKYCPSCGRPVKGPA